MAHVTIPDEEATIVYLNQTGTGPYSFTFTYFSAADIRVYVDEALLSSSAWSVTPATTLTGGYVGGVITLVDSVTEAAVTIERLARPGRASDFGVGGARPQGIDSAFDKLHAIVRDIHTALDRTPQFHPTDVSGPIFWPRAADRANKFIKFSTDGLSFALVAGADIETLAAVAGELNALVTVKDEIALLGNAATIADMALLGDADVILDMEALAADGVIAAMNAIKADIYQGVNSHILNALSNAQTATAQAVIATTKADEASEDAVSANLAENSVNTLLAQLNFFDGGNAYADVDAAVTAGAAAGQLYLKTDDTIRLILTVSPNTELQVSPLTSAQSTTLSDALLASLVGLATAANKGIYASGVDTLATFDLSTYFRSISNVASEAALKAAINLEIGTDVQAYSAQLTALAALSGTTYGRDFVQLANASAARSKISGQEQTTFSNTNPGYLIIPGSPSNFCAAFGSVALGSGSSSGAITFPVTFTGNPFTIATGGGSPATPASSNGTTTAITIINGSTAQTVRWLAIGAVA